MSAPTAADYVSPNPDISPPPNPTAIQPVESDGVHHVAKPDSQSNANAHGTNHPTLSQKSTMTPDPGGAYK